MITLNIQIFISGYYNFGIASFICCLFNRFVLNVFIFIVKFFLPALRAHCTPVPWWMRGGLTGLIPIVIYVNFSAAYTLILNTFSHPESSPDASNCFFILLFPDSNTMPMSMFTDFLITIIL